MKVGANDYLQDAFAALYYDWLNDNLVSTINNNFNNINMEFLDKTGVVTLWNKIKDYIGTETKKYLPLSGGTMTGDIVRKDNQNRTIYSITTVANGPWIQCNDNGNGRNITIDGSEIKIFGGGGTATIPNNIRYAWDNIHFSLWPDNITNRIYKFNLQKLIDDGYLIEE